MEEQGRRMISFHAFKIQIDFQNEIQILRCIENRLLATKCITRCIAKQWNRLFLNCDVCLRSITEDEMHGPDRHIRSLNRQIWEKTFRSIFDRYVNDFFFLSSYYFLFFFFLFWKYVNVVENRKKMENRKLGAKEGGEPGKILKFIVFFTCSLLDEYPTHRRCRLSSFEDWRQGARGGLVQLHQQQVAWKNDPGFFVLLLLSDAFPLMNHFFTNIIFLSPIIPLFFSILELLWIFPRKKKKTIRILEYVSSFIYTFFSLNDSYYAKRLWSMNPGK